MEGKPGNKIINYLTKFYMKVYQDHISQQESTTFRFGWFYC